MTSHEDAPVSDENVDPGGIRVVEVARASDTGLVRGHNEDRLLARAPLLAVADGMGGAKAGEVAAAIAVERLEAAGAKTPPEELRRLVEEANREIREMAGRNPDQAGMGTTLTAALVRGSHADLVHVGDSRAYLFRGGALTRLTEDHSLVNELVRKGEIAPEDADSHPHRNVITRALGAEPIVLVDEIEVALADGDVLLLCTDGLTAYVSDGAVRDALAGAATLDAAAAALVGLANGAGGADNTTVVLARLGKDGTPTDELPPDETVAAPLAETLQMPAVERSGKRPVKSVEVPPSPRAAPPARVLERVAPRRSRRGPILIAVVIAVLLLGGGVAWAASRTYVVERGPDGAVWVAHGFPWSPLGIDLSRPWQTTGVAATTVDGAEPGAIDSSARGQGDAVAVAARIVWRHGIPAFTPLEPPPAPPPSRPARRSTGA
jgi:protein phosphatase